MDNIILNPEDLFDPRPFGFSHVMVTPPGRMVFVAGQGGEDRTGTLAEGFTAQVRQAFSNLARALAAAGAQPRHVAKVTTYIVDHDETKLAPLTEAVQALFGDDLPAQTLVPVPRLALDGMLFEVDAMAVITDS